MAEPAAVARRVLLSAYTTLKVGGPAELWEVEDLADLREATRAPYRVLGGGWIARAPLAADA